MNAVESSGTVSLFNVISKFSTGVTKATAPSPREMSLRAENNRLSSDNARLKSENRTLESRKHSLERENRRLEADVTRLERETSSARNPYSSNGQTSSRLVDTFA